MTLLTGMTEDGQEVPVQVKPDGKLVAEGLPGPAGAVGPEGPTGPQGAKGDPGNPAAISGTAAAPGLSVVGDPNTGLYSPGADQLGLSTAGTGRVFVASDGKVGIGTSAPLGPLHVSVDSPGDITGLIAAIPGAFAGSQSLWLGAVTSTGSPQLGCKIRATYNYAGTVLSDLVFDTSSVAPAPTEKLRLTSDGYLRLAGKGIQFNGDTADANSLDDYEEGTWTPTVYGGVVPGTYTVTAPVASYTKVGNMVHAWAGFGFSAASGGSGPARIAGLPLAYKAGSAIVGSVKLKNVDTTAASSNGVILVNASAGGSTSMELRLNMDNSDAQAVDVTGLSVTSFLVIDFTYTV